MSERLSLREFQASLAEKLSNLTSQPAEASKLGFFAAGRQWLVALDEVSALTGATRITPVPWARPWFMGVVSVRGVLYGCTDLAAFLEGGSPTPAEGEIRLLLAHPRFGVNAALRVDRALGLRSVAGMRAAALTPNAPAWLRACWEASDGLIWHELDMQALVQDPLFLRAGQD